MLTGDVLRDQAAMLREMASRRRVCGNSPGEVHDLEMIARTLDTLAPEASGADSFVMVESAVRSLPPGYAFADAVEHANPAPPTSGEANPLHPQYEAGFKSGMAFEAAHRFTPTGESGAAEDAAAELWDALNVAFRHVSRASHCKDWQIANDALLKHFDRTLPAARLARGGSHD